MKISILVGSLLAVFLILMMSNVYGVEQNNMFPDKDSSNQCKILTKQNNINFTEFTLNVFFYGKLNESFFINGSDFSISPSLRYFIGGFSYKLYDSAGLFSSILFPFTISGYLLIPPQFWDRSDFIRGPVSIEAIGWGVGKITIRIFTG